MSKEPTAEKGVAERCPERECVCCTCALNASAEFGQFASPDDECCATCHAEIAAPDWPGYRCGTPTRVIPQESA